MGVAVALPLFAVALAVTLVAAATFARRLDRLGARYGLPEVWIGLLSAVAADGPEISSALVALIKGAHDAGIGVIVGSNTFNLATMLGVSAIVTGSVAVSRRALALEGSVGLAVTAIVIALLVGWLPVAAAVVLVACVLTPYLVLIVGGHDLAGRVGLTRLADLVLERGISEAGHDHGHGDTAEFATRRQFALMAVDLVLIVGGSLGMVQAALALGGHWGVAPALVGALVLGPATSIPNALTGIRLGLAGRGAALVTEAFNSNTINLVAGVALPSIFVSLAARSGRDHADLALLAASTIATVGLLAARGGIRRPGAALVVALYAAFVVATVA